MSIGTIKAVSFDMHFTCLVYVFKCKELKPLVVGLTINSA